MCRLFCIMILMVVVINGKPQGHSPTNTDDNVKIEKQVLYVLPTKNENSTVELQRTLFKNAQTMQSRTENTRDILEKIAQVNAGFGYNNQKGLRGVDYETNFNVRSTQPENYFDTSRQLNPINGRGFSEQSMSRLFENPITAYLLNGKNQPESNNEILKQESMIGHDDDDLEDEDEKLNNGQQIRRKITHKQKILMPNPLLMKSPNSMYSNFPIQQYPPLMTSSPSLQYPFYSTAFQNPSNLPSNIQSPYSSLSTNYGQLSTQNASESDNLLNFIKNLQQTFPEMNRPTSSPGRQVSWPWANYFPIVINDPFIALFDAVTQVVEYGPQADICKSVSNILRPKPKVDTSRSGKKYTIKITRQNQTDELPVHSPNNGIVTDEELDVTTPADNVEIDSLAIMSPQPSILAGLFNKGRKVAMGADDTESTKESDQNVRLTQANNDPSSNKRFWSKDNTGNGIFIHRLKVRKGGVAIAGPGGIATAGSGGTAIVGPNGIAYTQPDGVAIAGPGAKIIAVPPTLNLTELILNSYAQRNLTSLRSLPPGSKIVATGPTVYRNPGKK